MTAKPEGQARISFYSKPLAVAYDNHGLRFAKAGAPGASSYLFNPFT